MNTLYCDLKLLPYANQSRLAPLHRTSRNMLFAYALNDGPIHGRSSFGGCQVDRFLREMGLSVNEIREVDELEAILNLVSNCMAAPVPRIATWRR